MPCYKDTIVILCYKGLDQVDALLQGYKSFTVLQATGAMLCPVTRMQELYCVTKDWRRLVPC